MVPLRNRRHQPPPPRPTPTTLQRETTETNIGFTGQPQRRSRPHIDITSGHGLEKDKINLG
jgi:hypothetical protein